MLFHHHSLAHRADLYTYGIALVITKLNKNGKISQSLPKASERRCADSGRLSGTKGRLIVERANDLVGSHLSRSFSLAPLLLRVIDLP